MKSFSAYDMTIAPAGQARVLLLQGPSNWFFRDLGRALKKYNAGVHRIGFCPGDRLFWAKNAGGFTRCTASVAEFPAWITAFLERYGPTDIVMLGDGRFYHSETLKAAKAAGLAPRTHIIEHGLVRPGWVLVDPDGMGQGSRISERFRAAPKHNAVQSVPLQGASFAQYAAMDVAYHVPGMLFGWLYNKNYQRPGVVSQWEEYAGWVAKYLTRARSSSLDQKSQAVLDEQDETSPVFLFPLQLETDFQIRQHGRGKTLRAHLKDALTSFSKFAPNDALFLVKRHPLDNGRTPWRRLVGELASQLGLPERVLYFDEGGLEQMLDRADGVVTVNSTVGLQAILAGKPCFTLGAAAYDFEGLTAQTDLHGFWTSPEEPNAGTAADFRAFLLSEYHVPGGFDGPAAAVGVKALAERIIG